MQHNTELYLGVMSGTSLDGVDIALVDFAQQPPQCVTADCTPMPETLREDLTQLIKSGETTLQKLGEIDHRLALLYADCINHFLAKHHLSPNDIVAIGCHGQTIWHSPHGEYPFTMQIGDMNLLAVKTGIRVVGDFRRKDMAVGGQGAPLVPAFHQGVFADPKRIVAVLNIGGISNVSLLVSERETIGYDIGAGNTLLDSWIGQHLGERFDQDAKWAKTGTVNQNLLNLLLDEPFFQQPPPKSTGRELFNLEWLAEKLAKVHPCKPEDVQATLVEFTAVTIANDLQKIPNSTGLPCRLLVCGGGARNPLIMARLADLLPTWQVATTTDYGLNVDDVEAAAFAWLAYQRINGGAGNLPSVTGAKQAVSLGAIYPKVD